MVQEKEVADELRECSRKLSAPDGDKIFMGKNYDPTTGTLNLNKVYYHPDLKEAGVVIPLNRALVIQHVVQVIKENIPGLSRLILSDNRLSQLEPFAPLAKCCPNLTYIDLGKNKIHSVTELNYLKGLNLTEINLDENPFCDDYRDHNSYIR
ncbi:NXF1 [Cordylochernes scorpioides]|uniref:NXF1 n=1 Tax=Cordylochernes scorpioides TaxID=51811 RepID=A0ABY6LS18_9ARAC|nr:NXF1 [Cordylochernes scorpioides]